MDFSRSGAAAQRKPKKTLRRCAAA